MRTIKVEFDAMDWHLFTKATNPQKAHAALGYLGAWNQTFNHVQIFTRHQEMTAVYRMDPADPQPGYVIGAVWHTDTETFSFHS
jgi:hypothetical protein